MQEYGALDEQIIYFNALVSENNSVVECRICDQKASDFYESQQKQWENFILQGHLSVLTLFQYLLHPHVTAVAHERSQSFCQKCRWQITAKYTCTQHTCLQMKWHCKLVHGCMAYTEHAPRRQQFPVAPAMEQVSNLVFYA